MKNEYTNLVVVKIMPKLWWIMPLVVATSSLVFAGMEMGIPRLFAWIGG